MQVHVSDGTFLMWRGFEVLGGMPRAPLRPPGPPQLAAPIRAEGGGQGGQGLCGIGTSHCPEVGSEEQKVTFLPGQGCGFVVHSAGFWPRRGRWSHSDVTLYILYGESLEIYRRGVLE